MPFPEIRPYPSPNHASRREPVRLIVLHGTGMADDQAALQRLCSPEAEVSCHYFIDQQGLLFRLVEENRIAWHAGKSSWQGEESVNRFSLGIEISNPGDGTGEKAHPVEKVVPYHDVQYETLIALLEDLLARYELGPQAVVGHCHIAPGRKTDPWPHFDWSRLVRAGVADENLCRVADSTSSAVSSI